METGIRSMAGSLVELLVKVLTFFQELACGLEQRLANSVPPAQQSGGDNAAEVNGLLGPCLERLRRLEAACQEISRKPAQLPVDKDQVLLDSWDRIKSLEFDLEKTKKVVPPPPPKEKKSKVDQTHFFRGQVLQEAVDKQLEISNSLDFVNKSKVALNSSLSGSLIFFFFFFLLIEKHLLTCFRSFFFRCRNLGIEQDQMYIMVMESRRLFPAIYWGSSVGI